MDRKESGNQEEKVDNVKMLDLEKQIEMSVVAQCKEKLKESIETTMVDQAMAELPEGLKEITNLDEKQEKYVPLNQVNKVDSMVIEIKDLVYQMEMAEDKLQGSGEMDQAMDKVPAGLKEIEEQEGILAKREEKEDKAVPAASFVVAPKRCCGQRIFDTVLKHIAPKKGQSRRIRMFMLKHALVALICSLIGFIIQVELEAAAEKHHWTFPGQVAAYIAPRPLEIFATLFLTYLLFLRGKFFLAVCVYHATIFFLMFSYGNIIILMQITEGVGTNNDCEGL